MEYMVVRIGNTKKEVPVEVSPNGFTWTLSGSVCFAYRTGSKLHLDRACVIKGVAQAENNRNLSRYPVCFAEDMTDAQKKIATGGW